MSCHQGWRCPKLVRRFANADVVVGTADVAQGRMAVSIVAVMLEGRKSAEADIAACAVADLPQC